MTTDTVRLDRTQNHLPGETPRLLVQARGLTKSFGGVTAVKGVDLEVAGGELVGIMGPNGAGKSTLLSLLAGAQRATSGSLEVCGVDFSRIRHSEAAHAGVGLAHQVPKPFRKLTVRQNVEIASFVNPRSHRAEAIDHALELTGLADRAHKTSGQLGLLELKRLEVARVLALDTELVLLDEVAAGLNAHDLTELIDLVRAVHADGKTVVLVEHVQEVIHELAQRVVVLEWGEKLMEGTPAEVSNDPRVIEIYLGSGSENEVVRPNRDLDPEAEVRLRATGLHSGYGAVKVLDDVSLELRAGEILTVLGSNGAGKTTLAKTLQGMVRTSRGSIEFEGRNITSAPVRARTAAGMALVPEGRRLFGELTVRENLLLGLKTPRNEQPLERVYELFPKLLEVGERQAGALSGGEQQMVAIGRAIASEPEVIIFDELSLGLAPVIVDRMLEAVGQIAEWGVSVILIEQNVHKSLALADRALIMRRGRVVFSGTTEECTEDKIQLAYIGVEHDDGHRGTV